MYFCWVMVSSLLSGRRCRCHCRVASRLAANPCRSARPFTDIAMVLYKYLHVVFILPIYSHDFSISFNQAMFARKGDFVMITWTPIYLAVVAATKNGFLFNFFELYLILLEMIFSSCASNSSFFVLRILFLFQVWVCACVWAWYYERQFVFMCLSMALLRHSQFFSETSSFFCIFLLLTKSNSLTRTTRIRTKATPTAQPKRRKNMMRWNKEEHSKCYCFT